MRYNIYLTKLRIQKTETRRQKTEYRIQKLVLSEVEGTHDRIGKSGNQDNRSEEIRITGNQEKSLKSPDNLML